MKEADPETGAHFLETASWLVLLKSRSLLLQCPGEVPPSQELERALLDHEAWKATAGLLRSRMDAGGLGPGERPGVEEEGSPAISDVIVAAPPPTVQDALAAARLALAEAKAHAQGARLLEGESYPVAEVLARLEGRLETLAPGHGGFNRGVVC